jgi:hypothetical protein
VQKYLESSIPLSSLLMTVLCWVALTLSEELRDCVSGRDISEPPHGLLAAGRCLRILSNLLSCESNRTYVKNKVNKGLLEAMASLMRFLDNVLLTEEACQMEVYVKCLLDILYTAQNLTNYDDMISSSLTKQKHVLDILTSFALELRPKCHFRESHWECIQFMVSQFVKPITYVSLVTQLSSWMHVYNCKLNVELYYNMNK